MRYNRYSFMVTLIVAAMLSMLGITPASATGNHGGNASCPSGTIERAKFNFEGGSYVLESGGGITIVDADADGGSWSSEHLISAIVVKGGNNNHISIIDPAATSGTFSNAELPKVGRKGNIPDISNLKFCGPKGEVPPPAVNVCDHTNRPDGTSLRSWLDSNDYRFSDCFEYVVVKECGALNVEFTRNDTQFESEYSFRWAEGSEVPEDPSGDGGFPATWDEDYNNGSVDVTYYIVGPEKDYILGQDVPNWWESVGVTVTVDTNCVPDVTVPPTTPPVTVPPDVVPPTTPPVTAPPTVPETPTPTVTVPTVSVPTQPATLPKTGTGVAQLSALGIVLIGLGVVALRRAGRPLTRYMK